MVHDSGLYILYTTIYITHNVCIAVNAQDCSAAKEMFTSTLFNTRCLWTSIYVSL